MKGARYKWNFFGEESITYANISKVDNDILSEKAYLSFWTNSVIAGFLEALP